MQTNSAISPSKPAGKRRGLPIATALIAATLSAIATAPLTALANDSTNDMTWQYYQFNDEANRGRTTSQILVGIPETDNRIMEAKCDSGSSGTFSYLTLAAPVATLRDNDPIDILFKGDDYEEELSGMVSGLNAGEEALVGVRLLMENDATLWDKFTTLPTITYTVSGSDMTLPLAGSRQAIKNFLKDCRYYASQFTETKAIAIQTAEGTPPPEDDAEQQEGEPEADNSEGPTGWFLDAGEPDETVALYYGVEGNDELTDLVFLCLPGTGKVDILVMESSEKYKAGEGACVTFSTEGAAGSKFCGATVPNELAGIPGLEAVAPINDPIFQSLKPAGNLTLDIDGEKSDIPLDTLADSAATFVKSCTPQS